MDTWMYGKIGEAVNPRNFCRTRMQPVRPSRATPRQRGNRMEQTDHPRAGRIINQG